jgi:hypothetical protein
MENWRYGGGSEIEQSRSVPEYCFGSRGIRARCLYTR